MILYTDKSELFECNVSVDGASIDNTTARLVVEGKKWNLVFYGEVENNGKCKINIGGLNIFNEGDNGKIRLEIIADDTVFIPWKDDFQVKTNKKVTVEMVSHSNKPNTISESRNGKVAVNVQVSQKDLKSELLSEIAKDLIQNGITANTINENKALLMNIIFNKMEKFNLVTQENIDWVAENINTVLKD